MSRLETSAVLLKTDRLRLRRLSMSDLDDLATMDGDPEVMRYVTGGIPRTREDIAARFLPATLEYTERWESYGFWAAECRSDGRFLGWFHFRPFHGDERQIELGYRLVREVWGRGLATEGSRALVEHGFTRLGVPKVVATALASNHASQRVMSKAGLRFESTFVYPKEKLPGWSEKARRAVKYGIERETWRAERSVR